MLARYYRDLLIFCWRKTGSRDTAADLAQESFARVLAMQQTGQTIQHPAALLQRIATNAKVDMDRRAAVRQADDLDGLDEGSQPTASQHTQPEEAYASKEAVQAYLEAIASLPPRCREAFSLHVFDDISKQEIANRMGVSLSMIKQYITRGKAVCAARRQALESASTTDRSSRT
ncbi:RNA polymerase sigma factor [Variovorax sp. LT1R16]|uniref:RNA polymerase sigma factor n=1 Tax=Variovorax sp. LT1R16 TaxID=3443728 RepID=UPI003F456B4B